MVRWYMLEKSKQLTAMQRMFLAQATTQPLSFYEVVWNEPGERMRVWDVLLGGETKVIERSGSLTLAAGRPSLAQIWHQPELAVFGSYGTHLHSAGQEDRSHRTPKQTEGRIAKKNRYLAPHDLLRYADLIRATYLGTRDRLFASAGAVQYGRRPAAVSHADVSDRVRGSGVSEWLAPLAVGHSREELLDDAELSDDGKLRKVDIDWIKEGNRKFKTWHKTILGHIKISEGRVIAEVNSENRAKRLRREIAKSGSVRWRSTKAPSPKRWKRCGRIRHKKMQIGKQNCTTPRWRRCWADSEVRNDPGSHPCRSKSKAGFTRRSLRWAGARRREAVRDPDGKEMVEALLLDWERRDERDVSPNQIRPDISVLRRLLNLAPQAS